MKLINFELNFASMFDDFNRNAFIRFNILLTATLIIIASCNVASATDTNENSDSNKNKPSQQQCNVQLTPVQQTLVAQLQNNFQNKGHNFKVFSPGFATAIFEEIDKGVQLNSVLALFFIRLENDMPENSEEYTSFKKILNHLKIQINSKIGTIITADANLQSVGELSWLPNISVLEGSIKLRPVTQSISDNRDTTVQMQSNFMLAVKRAERKSVPADWHTQVTKVPGVTVINLGRDSANVSNSRIVVISSTDEVAEQLRAQFPYLFVEKLVPHHPTNNSPGIFDDPIPPPINF